MNDIQYIIKIRDRGVMDCLIDDPGKTYNKKWKATIVMWILRLFLEGSHEIWMETK